MDITDWVQKSPVHVNRSEVEDFVLRLVNQEIEYHGYIPGERVKSKAEVIGRLEEAIDVLSSLRDDLEEDEDGFR